ncbi:hypothetical protein ACFW04_014499 [Cataglyphis niger]
MIAPAVKNCEFKEEDAKICSQIVEYCTLSEIRRRILEKHEITLKEVLDIADYQSNRNADKHRGADARLTGYGKRQNKRTTGNREITCFRCKGYKGGKGYTYKDDKCLAKGRKCNKCGEIEHFAGTCKIGDRASAGRQEGWRQGKSVKELKRDNDEDDSHAFGLQKRKLDVYQIEMEKIHAYGQNKALELLGKLKCNFKISDRKTRATFVVMKGKGKETMGYETAKELGILWIELEAMINSSETRYEDEKIFKGIRKLENFKLELAIDRSRPPVAKP